MIEASLKNSSIFYLFLLSCSNCLPVVIFLGHFISIFFFVCMHYISSMWYIFFDAQTLRNDRNICADTTRVRKWDICRILQVSIEHGVFLLLYFASLFFLSFFFFLIFALCKPSAAIKMVEKVIGVRFSLLFFFFPLLSYSISVIYGFACIK